MPGWNGCRPCPAECHRCPMFHRFPDRSARLTRGSACTYRFRQSTRSQRCAPDMIEAAAAPGWCCPRCQGTGLYRHGTANDLQRFRCRGCGGTCTSLTSPPAWYRTVPIVERGPGTQKSRPSLFARAAQGRNGAVTGRRWLLAAARPGGLPAAARPRVSARLCRQALALARQA